MSKKTKKLRFISLFWDYVSALSLILLLMLFWKLGKGPIEVNFLRPYIIQALTNDTSSYDLNVKSVNLELVHSVQPIKIIAKDVSFKDKEDNYSVIAPRLALSFSTRALLKGLLAPSSINIENPKIKITTFYDIKKDTNQTSPDLNETNLKKLEFYFEQFEDFMERFNSPEKLYLESFINQINISNAEISMTEAELGHQFTFINANLSFLRGLTDIKIKADSAVKFLEISALDSFCNFKANAIFS